MIYTKSQAKQEAILKGMRSWKSMIKLSMRFTGNPAERADNMQNFNTAVDAFRLQVQFEKYPKEKIDKLRDQARHWYKGKW